MRIIERTCLIAGLISCMAFAAPEKGLSPGPPGGFIDDDYRVPLLWLKEPGNYGAGEYGRRLQHGGRDRYYQFYVPKGYKKGTPSPVVLVLHGGGGNPNGVRFESGMNSVADKENF